MTTFYTSVVSRGKKILYRGIENGRRVKRELAYRPYLFVSSEIATDYRAVDGRYLQRVDFENVSEAKEFLKNYPAGMVHGYDRFQYLYIHDNFGGNIEHDPSLVRIGTIDIEVSTEGGMPDLATANKEITAITYMVGESILAFGYGDFTTDDPNVRYFKCRHEKDLIRKFLAVWESAEYCPDVITGWNIEGFDIPYMVTRFRNILGDSDVKRLSPWRVLQPRKVFTRGKYMEVEFPLGIAVLDYMAVYEKLAVGPGAVARPDDYKLNTIAHNELGEKKLDYSAYDDLLDLYKKNHQLFMEYNIRDVLLVKRINDKRQLIELIMTMAYKAHCNYEDMLGTVRPWECLLHHRLMNQNIIMPPRKDPDTSNELVGGYVKNPEPKGFEWVVSFDLNSLYPHLIMQYNISAETRIGKDQRTALLAAIQTEQQRRLAA